MIHALNHAFAVVGQQTMKFGNSVTGMLGEATGLRSSDLGNRVKMAARAASRPKAVSWVATIATLADMASKSGNAALPKTFDWRKGVDFGGMATARARGDDGAGMGLTVADGGHAALRIRDRRAKLEP